MKKIDFSKVVDYLSKNKVLISFSIGIGGIISVIAINIFANKVINQSYYNRITNILKANFNSPANTVTNVTMWIMLVSLVALFLVPILYNNKNSIAVVLLTIFIVFDILLAIITFCNQRIDASAIIFVSISFMYYIFIICILAKSIYSWLHKENNELDVVKLTFLWTVIVALLGISK